jgi:hypothetical protein
LQKGQGKKEQMLQEKGRKRKRKGKDKKEKKKKEKTASQDPSEYGWTPSYCHQPL